ncbi:MAG: hypothetical protein WC122_04570 [archaeon]
MKDFKAQGAIEYLLIIGVVILIVAVAIIALSGVLTQGSSSVKDDSLSYYDSLMDLKTEHIGLSFKIKAGTHESFTVAVQPEDNSLNTIFSSAPNGTTVRINFDSTHEKKDDGWTNGGGEAVINLGDVVDISVPSGTTDLKINLKGNYTKPSPQKIILTCDGSSVKNYSIVVYFPLKEKRLKTIFKNFFDEPVLGTELTGVISGAWTSYKSRSICSGVPCIDLNEFECTNTNGFCDWNTQSESCYSSSEINDCNNADPVNDFLSGFDLSSCEKVGCDTSKYEFYGWYEDVIIEEGSNIDLTCGINQTLDAVLEEDESIVINRVEDVNVVQYSVNSFYLKNYYCYDFNKLYNSFRKVIVPLVSSGGFFSVTCYRGEEKATGVYSKNIWGSVTENVTNGDLKIFYDTICSITSYTPNIPTISLVCD